MTNYIYAYTHIGMQKSWSDGVSRNGDYLIKVGQSRRPGMERVREQLIVAFPKLEGVRVFFHSEEAVKPDGTSFSDGDIHKLLKQAGVSGAGGEWFEASSDEVRAAVASMQRGASYELKRTLSFGLRDEQAQAIESTKNYFLANPEQPKFLWNAKMRFGKTFASYMLAKEMGWKRVLVLTYKPSVRNAWKEDLLNHIEFEGWSFIDSSVPEDESKLRVSEDEPLVWFASFQDATGKTADGKIKDRNRQLHEISWDCVIVDEFHYGASTSIARELYDPQDKESVELAKVLEAASGSDEKKADVEPYKDFGVKSKYQLHLSGTPFKAVARGDYNENQVFEWTYTEEQKAKKNWPKSRGDNPYDALPDVEMYNYEIGNAVKTNVKDFGELEFDLSQYFKAKKSSDGSYVFEDLQRIKAFLDFLRGGVANNSPESEKPLTPYGSEKFQNSVMNSVWLMRDVASCLAMKAALESHPYFKNYVIHAAVGAKAGIGASALGPVKRAIISGASPEKFGSITLSCGKLMTGATVPEWSSIFMLTTLRAPESYFQAAFRPQSPWVRDGQVLKHKCLIFEFDPNRALGLVSRYGIELSTASKDKSQTQVLDELLMHLPVYSVEDGKLSQLNANDVIVWANSGLTANSLARKIQSHELFNLTIEPLKKILGDKELLSELNEMDDFRDFAVEAKKVVTTTRELTGGGGGGSKGKKDDLAKKRSSIRSKLRKLNSRLMIFMYLTDFREEKLNHVIEGIDPFLFKKSTGFSIASFTKLVEYGVFNRALMDETIMKYRYFEMKSFLEIGFNARKAENTP